MYTRPSNLDDALGLLAEGARVMAGATDIFPGAGESPLRGNYVDVTTIAALRGVRLQRNAVRIGATTTWSDIVAADLPPAFDALKAAARSGTRLPAWDAPSRARCFCQRRSKHPAGA
jgi:CO/xanthine dehydrogenase FAD-binding subunit